MTQRDNRLPLWVPVCTTPYSGATRRCPVQPSTPLGPDQVNVLLLLLLLSSPADLDQSDETSLWSKSDRLQAPLEMGTRQSEFASGIRKNDQRLRTPFLTKRTEILESSGIPYARLF
jgi:hypothetical protein